MNTEILDEILEVLDSQRVAVLSTIESQEPYSCLVSYYATKGLESILFTTKRARRKYRNILQNPRVSLVIDTRSSEDFDLFGTTVISIMGPAIEYNGHDRTRYIDLLKAKHPYLSAFVSEDDTALILVKIEKLIIVDSFERVRSFEF
ncbi:MAG: pyridoxamine 5'-phosphate oxidase family protein [Candidatus Thorarchaeota archaeon]